MEISPNDLAGLLYGFPAFEFRVPLSLHPAEQALIHRIRIVPLDIGKLIADTDKPGEVFHVEFFPQLFRAEIWSAIAWRESVTRYLKLRAEHRANDPACILQDRLEAVEKAIAYHIITRFKMAPPAAYAAATGMVRIGIEVEVNQLLALPDNILAQLDEVQKLMKEHEQSNIPNNSNGNNLTANP